jgi:hypothetical protein
MNRFLAHLRPTRPFSTFRACLATAILVVAISLGVSGQGFSEDVSLEASRTVGAAATYGDVPLAFEPNRGQAESGVRFAARAKGLAVLLRDREVSLAVPAGVAGRVTVLRMTYVGADFANLPVAKQKQQGVSNYLLGQNSAKWHTGIPNFGSVEYGGLYPGIDLVFYGNHRKLEHDFRISAGADYHQIRVRLDGAKALKVTTDGELLAETATGDVTFQPPDVYQEQAGGRVSVHGEYVVLADNVFGFELGGFDRARDLVIDPVLRYSTYLAGTSTDVGNAIAVDAQGNAYITGYTFSPDFPVLTAEQGTCNPSNCNPQDAFVTKLNATGTGLVYSTFVGGTGADQGSAIAVDSLGNVAVAGWTSSFDFPQVNGATVVLSNYSQHGMAFSLTPSGAAFNFSTYLGGVGQDSATGVAMDTSGSVYVSGYTGSSNFVVTPGHQIGPPPTGYYGIDIFLAKFGRKGKLAFSTMVGGIPSGTNATFTASPVAVGVDRKGEAVLAGAAYSGFPTTAGCFQAAYPGTNTSTSAAFVGRLNAAGTAFLAASYLGGTGGDAAVAVNVTSTGIVYVAGTTGSTDFPTTSGSFQPTVLSSGYQRSFVTKMNVALSKLTYSSYLGGTGAAGSYGSVTATGIAADAAGNAYVVGSTNISDFPLASALISLPPTTLYYGNSTAAFLSVLNPTGSALTFSTLFSGSSGAAGSGVAIDTASHALITGWTSDGDLPTTAGSFQSTITPPANGYYTQHAFVTEFLMSQANASACLSTNSLFLASLYGKPSFPSPLVISNCGTMPLKISGIVSSNPVFTVAKGLCTTVAAGAACTAHVKYTPIKGILSDTGTIQIADNAPLAPQKIGVSGYAYYPNTGLYSGTTLGFQDTPVGVTSSPSFAYVQNYSSVALHITAVKGSGGFTGVNQCPKALQPGNSCLVGATFTPTVAGITTGTLTVYDDALDSPQTLGLSGNGLATYPTPTGLSLSPSYAPAGSAAVQVYLGGNAIYSTSTLLINGKPFTGKVTLSYGQLQFTLPTSMLTKIGSLAIQVVNPDPGGASLPVDFSVYGQTTLPAADFVFEPFTQKFYATLPASSTVSPNSLVTIDPTTGAIGTPIAIGLDPGALGLSDDGQILYVALNGENAIVPFNLATQTAGAKIQLPVDIAKGLLTAADIQVQPGNSGTLVVTLAAGYNGNDGLALIVNGQIVSQYLNESPNNVYVGGTHFVGPSDVFGWSAAYNATGILHFVIVGNQLLEAPGIGASYGVGTFATDGSNLFDINGQVFSSSTGVLVGTINGLGSFPSGPVGALFDAPSNRVFFSEGPFNSSTEIIDATSLQQVGFSGGPPAVTSRLEKWGPDGLAYLTGSYPQTTGSALVQIRSSLFYTASGTDPLPTVTAFLPATATAAGANFVLAVTGSNFVPGSVVRVRGANRTTKYLDSKTLLVDIPASDLTTAGTAKITVFNPAPGGGVSAELGLPIL